MTLKSTTNGTIGKVIFPDTVSATKAIVFTAEIDNGNSGTSKTIDWTSGNKQKLTMTGNCTLTFTAPAGACTLTLRLIQSSGGHTATWPTIKWLNAAAGSLTAAAAAVDVLTLYYDGTNYWGTLGTNFA